MAERQIIHSERAPAAVGPYSQAIRHGDLIYTSGQIAIDPATGSLIDGGIEAQAHQVLTNLRAVLEAAGSDLDHVLKTTVFLTTMGHYQQVNTIYAEYFNQSPPARSAIAVADLPLGALVEIECTATIRNS
jgi:2-iminobutanoate/2-iminopropanoate deaminase